MTAQLLRSPLKNRYQLIHFNISKGRDVSTKARFDWINVAYGLVQPFQLFWLMVSYRPAIVYTNLAQNPGGFLRYASFVLVVSFFNTPVVVRVMGDGFNHFYARASRVLQWLIRLTLKQITRFIVRAEVLKRQFDTLVPSQKLRVVYSGIAIDDFDRPRSRQRNGQVRVLFVGYLTKAKGALDLLQAVPMVTAVQPQVMFQFMGSRIDVERNITYVDNPQSNERALQRLLSQKEVMEHVELLGVQSGEEKIKTFVNADIFVLPSYSEAFPTVVLEAIAAGLPVITTAVGAIPEAFSENALLLVEPGNIPQLTEAILTLVRDPELRQRLVACGRQMVQEKFNLDAYANRVDGVFREMIG